MANSPIYNWPEPDNTDLVKNGALAIRTLGNAIDTTMATMTPKSLVDAKGDLVTATANDTPARLAVGADGSTLVANSAAATGLSWAGPINTAGKNAVINGGFDIWQRGTSGTFAGTLTYPSADRWFGVCTGTAPTCTISRQTADSTFLTYGLRFGRNSGQTNTGDVYVGTVFESQDIKKLAGQTVTLSFYIKAGANAPLSIASQIRTGTGTDQSAATIFSTGWTGGANNPQTNTVTTTMTRYSQTVTLGSTVNQIGILFTYTPTGTAGANEWFQVEGLQLEVGSVATPFSRNAGTIAGELAACQRYYYRVNNDSGVGSLIAAFGSCDGTTIADIIIPFPSQMRIAPTSLDQAQVRIYNLTNGTNYSGGTWTLGGSNNNFGAARYTHGSGVFTSGLCVKATSSGAGSAYLGFNAEL